MSNFELLEVVEDRLIKLQALADMITNVNLDGDLNPKTISEIGYLMDEIIVSANDVVKDLMFEKEKDDE